MTYTALYRKYRPLTFDEVVGQHDVVETLKNKVITGKIGHAVLLTGSRGTGKTTLAKIFARAVNCLNPRGANPCNECDVCRGILSESVMDVIEMDAASNNGVDDVRAINEKVKFPPSVARYKVFIVDEVHMMSKAAFNAFLKTLEEPPPYMLFIFATTDPQAIPNTVLSRCQRFDLKRVNHGDIFLRLESVCRTVGLDFTSEGLELIVRHSDGAVRDALGFLDKASGYSNVIDKENVTSAIGLVDDDVLFELLNAVLDRNLEKALLTLNRVIESGRNEAYFLIDLQNHFRNMMMLTVGDGLSKLIMRDDEYIGRLMKIKSGVSFTRLIMIIEKLSDGISRLKHSENTRITLETSIAGICIPDLTGDSAEIIARLDELEARLSQGTVDKRPYFEKKEEAVHSDSCDADSGDDNAFETQSASDDEDERQISLDMIKEDWERVKSVVQRESILTYNYMDRTQPVSLNGKTVTVLFKSKLLSFYERMLEKKRQKHVENAMHEVFGESFRIDVVLEVKEDKIYNDDDVLSFFEGFEDELKIL